MMAIPYEQPAAMAEFRGGDAAPKLTGWVKLYPRRDGALVVAEVTGLPQTDTGFYGFHIHEGTVCGEDFSQTEGHYNPTGAAHPNHAGDLPPLLGRDGNAYLAFRTNRFRVSDVIGRTVVIHRDPDDLHTQPAGNSGEKIACGVIEKT